VGEFPNKQNRVLVQAYVSCFENLEPEKINEIQALISDDFNFVDPFNDVKGREKIDLLLHRMFEDLDSPKFKILDVLWSTEHCFIRCDFQADQKWLGAWRIRGFSELRINAQGEICAHLDYWDSGRNFYSRLPLIGPIVRWVARRASI